jgi:hypothetical protein
MYQSLVAGVYSILSVVFFQPEAEELKSTAAQGILLCLEDTIKNLRENQVSSLGQQHHLCTISAGYILSQYYGFV